MDPKRAERRLAAIMFTDIVGYTALMAGNEARALKAKAQHRALVRPLVERYHGESIEARGDESLSVFPSVLDAVNCAFAIEAELGDSGLKLHLGIHLGDFVLERGEISGDGVNIAARLCALSEAGGLCVSGEVYQAVRNQPNIEAKPLGERELKNVGRPIAVYALSGPAAPPSIRRAPTSSTSVRIAAAVGVGLVLLFAAIWGVQRYFVSPSEGPGVAGLANRPALAVLPFENLSEDPEQGVFAGGLGRTSSHVSRAGGVFR
jgi:adenylate cyclase